MTAGSPESDRLRYPIGEFRNPGSLTSAERRAAIAAVAETPERLRRAVAGLDAGQIDTRYRPGGWTVRQVVHHLVDSHLNSFARFKLGLTEEHPTIRTYDEAAWAEQADHRGEIEPSVELLALLHGRWVALLDALDETQWARTIDHPEMGDLRLDALLALYAWHGPHHVAQIEALRRRRGW